MIGGTCYRQHMPYQNIAEAYQEQRADLVVLDGLQRRSELKLGQYNDSVAAIYIRVADDDETVDVRHGKQAQDLFGVVGLISEIIDHLAPKRLLVGADLHCLC